MNKFYRHLYLYVKTLIYPINLIIKNSSINLIVPIFYIFLIKGINLTVLKSIKKLDYTIKV